jgi:hypothetical protein
MIRSDPQLIAAKRNVIALQKAAHADNLLA